MTDHRSVLDACVHINPSNVIVGNQFADGNVPPVSTCKTGVMLSRGWRMVDEVLNGGLGEGRVSLGAR
jgi:hypothetical protein